MTPTALALAFLVLIASGLAYALACVNRELRLHLGDLTKQRDYARQEVQALTDAIARANGLSVQRPREAVKREPLLPSEGYWDSRGEVTKVTAG